MVRRHLCRSCSVNKLVRTRGRVLDLSQSEEAIYNLAKDCVLAVQDCKGSGSRCSVVQVLALLLIRYDYTVNEFLHSAGAHVMKN